VDGPDFDGHAVDFDEAINRSAVYGTERAHACNLFKENK
jgi:putative oxidoreductase, NAD-binding